MVATTIACEAVDRSRRSAQELEQALSADNLVLSSHLLFTYADRLDDDWHRAALQEMARVSRGRVRVFPLVDQAGARLTGLVERFMSEVRAAGVAATLRPVPFEFQRGAGEMLELDVSTQW